MNGEKILIGKVLKDIRYSLGFTQEKVAEILGMSPRYISDIERDKSKGSIDTLIKLCNIYDVTPTFIFKDYLNNSNLEYEDNVCGFHNLKDSEKQIIIELVQSMNKNHKN